MYRILAWWLEFSPMSRETWVQYQVESYQRLKKWYLMPLCLTLIILRYGSRVKWSNPGKGVASSPTPWCSSYRKGSFRVALDYSRQLLLLIFLSCSLSFITMDEENTAAVMSIGIFQNRLGLGFLILIQVKLRGFIPLKWLFQSYPSLNGRVISLWTTLALEPRIEASNITSTKPTEILPPPDLFKSLSGKMPIPNLNIEPLTLKRNERFIRFVLCSYLEILPRSNHQP